LSNAQRSTLSAGNPRRPGGVHFLLAQIGRHQADQFALAIQPLRHRLQLAANVVLRKHFEYSGLDGAFLTHCRLRR
jgi:hypothetical protein